jgi:hypothetical protein
LAGRSARKSDVDAVSVISVCQLESCYIRTKESFPELFIVAGIPLA